MSSKSSTVPAGTANKLIKYEDLTYKQKERHAVLSGVFPNKETVLRVISYLEPKGENSYAKVMAKLQNVIQANHETQQYQDAIADNFEIGQTYLNEIIISDVAGIRRDFQLPPYISSIKTNSIRELCDLFLVQPVYPEDTSEEGAETTTNKRKVIGYIPLFKLKPDDE